MALFRYADGRTENINVGPGSPARWVIAEAVGAVAAYTDEHVESARYRQVVFERQAVAIGPHRRYLYFEVVEARQPVQPATPAPTEAPKAKPAGHANRWHAIASEMGRT